MGSAEELRELHLILLQTPLSNRVYVLGVLFCNKQFHAVTSIRRRLSTLYNYTEYLHSTTDLTYELTTDITS